MKINEAAGTLRKKSPGETEKRTGLNKLRANLAAYKYMYLLFLPAVVFYIMFAYRPMAGVLLAFKDYSFRRGIWGSAWVGLKNFQDVFHDSQFLTAFRNTLAISFGRLAFEFPIGILLALLLNELRWKGYRRSVQTFLTLPHFLSWVVIMGIFYNLFSDMGLFNELLTACGLQKISPLTQAGTFRIFLYATDNWKEAGWNAIIYLAAISGVNPELYEAAIVDGASRWHLVKYVTLPAILSVIGVMFILQLSNIMNAGFDQIFNLYNAAVYSTGDILDTYIYRRTFSSGADFGTSTAMGLFKSVINFILLIFGNSFVKKLTGKGIY